MTSSTFKPLTSLLIANRGEIAIRIARSAAELGIKTTAVYAEDDAASLHTVKCDAAIALKGQGVPAYLDGAGIIFAARHAGADAIHPGYGFLSENAAFARQCAEAGLVFVGPTPETLDLFGDKAQARRLAERLDVPVLPGTNRPTTLAEARAFLAAQGPGRGIMIKAIAGGGGRGMRPVLHASELDQAFERCQSEAQMAFGSGDVYVEMLYPEGPPYRGAGDRRRHWRGVARLGAGMLAAAPAPEDRRDRAGPASAGRYARPASGGGRGLGQGRQTPLAGDDRIPRRRVPGCGEDAGRASPSSRPIRACRSSIP